MSNGIVIRISQLFTRPIFPRSFASEFKNGRIRLNLRASQRSHRTLQRVVGEHQKPILGRETTFSQCSDGREKVPTYRRIRQQRVFQKCAYPRDSFPIFSLRRETRFEERELRRVQAIHQADWNQGCK